MALEWIRSAKATSEQGHQYKVKQRSRSVESKEEGKEDEQQIGFIVEVVQPPTESGEPGARERRKEFHPDLETAIKSVQ